MAQSAAVEGSSGHGYSPHLAHHFESMEQQLAAGKLGIWLFLSTEILLFGGLFCAYAVYRANHPEIFTYAHQYLSKLLGGVNTVFLICSSLTMAWAVRCAQRDQRRGLIVNLALTLLLACCFLGIKGIEYRSKWREGLLWGTHFAPIHAPGEHAQAPAAASAPGEHSAGSATAGEGAAPGQASHVAASAPAEAATGQAGPTAATAPDAERSAIPPSAPGPGGLAAPPGSAASTGAHGIAARPGNVHIFFGIYFAMTGLHGLHVLAGMSVIGWVLVRAVQGHWSSANCAAVDYAGLYWHLVDLVWIYLFPLLYLIH